MILEPYDKGPVGSTFDVTISNGSPGLLAFFAGEQGIYWSQKPVRIIFKDITLSVTSWGCNYFVFNGLFILL